MRQIAIFGAGQRGRRAQHVLKIENEIVCFIDNNESLQGEIINGIKVVSLRDYKTDYYDAEIIISLRKNVALEIEQQLKQEGISSFEYYEDERLISWSNPIDMEDVILYHAFKNIENIFYIDIGSNDPTIASVTKLLYDLKDACGINIEPQKDLLELTRRERKRDINLCIGIGEKKSRLPLYLQGGLSTTLEQNVKGITTIEEIEIVPLREVCDEYVGNKTIHFLKIDVEGMEKEVLLGGDFTKYRPWIICIESTIPESFVPCYDEWEDILISKDYVFAKMIGVNRYYVAKEHNEMIERILSKDELKQLYLIYSANVQVYE